MTKRETKKKSSFALKNVVSTFRPLELLHTDLFDFVRTTSIGGKKIWTCQC